MPSLSLYLSLPLFLSLATPPLFLSPSILYISLSLSPLLTRDPSSSLAASPVTAVGPQQLRHCCARLRCHNHALTVPTLPAHRRVIATCLPRPCEQIPTMYRNLAAIGYSLGWKAPRLALCSVSATGSSGISSPHPMSWIRRTKDKITGSSEVPVYSNPNINYLDETFEEVEPSAPLKSLDDILDNYHEPLFPDPNMVPVVGEFQYQLNELKGLLHGLRGYTPYSRPEEILNDEKIDLKRFPLLSNKDVSHCINWYRKLLLSVEKIDRKSQLLIFLVEGDYVELSTSLLRLRRILKKQNLFSDIDRKSLCSVFWTYIKLCEIYQPFSSKVLKNKLLKKLEEEREHDMLTFYKDFHMGKYVERFQISVNADGMLEIWGAALPGNSYIVGSQPELWEK